MAAFSLPFRPRPFSPVPYQPSFFPFFLVLLRFFSFLFLSAAGALLWLVLAVDKRARPGKAREAQLLWLAAPSGPIAFYCILDSNATLGTRPRRSRLPVRLALERDCGSLLPSLSPSPVQACTLPAFFLSLFSCSSSFLFFPFPFCCRRTPGQTSAAWKSAGSEAFVAGTRR